MLLALDAFKDVHISVPCPWALPGPSSVSSCACVSELCQQSVTAAPLCLGSDPCLSTPCDGLGLDLRVVAVLNSVRLGCPSPCTTGQGLWVLFLCGPASTALTDPTPLHWTVRTFRGTLLHPSIALSSSYAEAVATVAGTGWTVISWWRCLLAPGACWVIVPPLSPQCFTDTDTFWGCGSQTSGHMEDC